MPVPFSLMSPGFQETLVEQRFALENRVKNATLRLHQTATYHRGTPDPHALPADVLGIWLDWDGYRPDDQEPYEASMLVMDWHIYIVALDEGNDLFGSDSPTAEQVWGDILKTFIETNKDIGLDGSIDYVPTPRGSHFRGHIAGGDRRVEVIEMVVEAHWSMQYARHGP